MPCGKVIFLLGVIFAQRASDILPCGKVVEEIWESDILPYGKVIFLLGVIFAQRASDILPYGKVGGRFGRVMVKFGWEEKISM